MADLYLASQSPRRRELLMQIGVNFSVVTVAVPEQQQPGEVPVDYVQRLALAKSWAGSALVADAPVLGADTIVVLGQQVLEKPVDQADAVGMLLQLSGQTHQVLTAVAVCHKSQCHSRLSRTQVTFRQLTAAEAEHYWTTGEPADKAGGYGIQGLGSVFVTAIDGSYSGVVGLPLAETADLLTLFNVPYGLSVSRN